MYQSLTQKIREIIFSLTNSIHRTIRKWRNLYYTKLYYHQIKRQSQNHYTHNNLIPLRTAHRAQDKTYPQEKKHD